MSTSSPPSDVLASRAAATPEAVALEAPGIEWSWRRLDAAATSLAGRLREAGIGTRRRVGDGPEAETDAGERAGERGRPVVAGLIPRTPAGVAALHGVPRAGAILALLHPGWTEAELGACIERLRPSALLVPRDRWEAPRALPGDIVRLPLEEPRERGNPAGADPDVGEDAPVPTGEAAERVGTTGAAARPPDRRGSPGVSGAREEPASIHTVVATSGSSGRPKLVALEAASHLASARAAARHLGLGREDRWLASLEPAHIGGLALLLRTAVVGCPVVLRRRFDPEEWNDLLERRGITHASLVPVMLRRMLAARAGRPAPATLRCLLLGGASSDPELLAEALELGFPLALTYGQTETASQVATAPPALTRRKPGTVGPPLPGSEIRISPGGEVRVRGPTLMAGYWDEASDDRFDDGWLRTGDLGRVDREGHLWIEGRLSERIVTGGTNVDPLEVEAVLTDHHGVGEAAVVGVADPEWGERVAAAVVPATAFGVGRAELEAWCRERLAAPKRPREWIFLESMPRTPTGKPDRSAIGVLFRATPR